MRTTRAPPNILIRANIYNNDPIRYIVLVVSCFVLPIPNIYRDTSVLIPSLIHAATDTVVRRPHGRLPGDRLARLDLLARRRLAEEAPGHTAPKLRGAHARNSAQGVLMRRQTWRTPDVAATLRPMVRNAPRWDRSPPAWRRGTNFFKQNYPGHECSSCEASSVSPWSIL